MTMSLLDDLQDPDAWRAAIIAAITTRISWQAGEVLGVAVANRFVPSAVQSVVNNPLTRYAGRYIANRPLATMAAFWFAAYRNAMNRPQWAGPYTREIETAALIPIFGQTPFLLRSAAHIAALPLRPEIAARVIALGDRLGLMRAPTITRRLFNNPVTRRAVTYAGRHPAALLASYFASQWIDMIYRPQFFGPYSQELTTAGLMPLFAHGPRTVPSILRGAGNLAYWSRAERRGVLSGFCRHHEQQLLLLWLIQHNSTLLFALPRR